MIGKFFGEYSNSWGHLIMSIVSLVFVSCVLIFVQDVTAKALAISIATLVIGYWFGSSIPKIEAVHSALNEPSNKEVASHATQSTPIQQPGDTTTEGDTKS